jgi:uncharacterized protein (TIGR02466 family)
MDSDYNLNIELIFPTAIGVVDNDNFDDHSEILDLEYGVTEGSHGQFETSTDTYVLDNHVPNLRNWIQHQLDNYSQYALSTHQKLKFTQSWCLKHNDTRQEVFPHSHPNSIISGAYYIEADEDSANLTFHRKATNMSPSVVWEMDQEMMAEAPWNFHWKKIASKRGRLVLFPSQLMHSVDGEIPIDGTRCVLSFNTWFEGGIGNDDKLNRLGPL